MPDEDDIIPTWDAPGVAQLPPLPADLASEGTAAAEALVEAEPVEEVPSAPAALPPCAVCGSPRSAGASYCGDCGYHFPPGSEVPVATAIPLAEATPVTPVPVGAMVRERFELRERLSETNGVERFRGVDHATGEPVPVIVLRASVPTVLDCIPVEAELIAAEATDNEDDVMVSFDDPTPQTQPVTLTLPGWPRPSWEQQVLKTAAHPFLPAVIDSFTEEGFEYLIEEVPVGRSLWDAWDDPDSSAEQRFRWLRHVAEQLHALHGAGAIVESLRPNQVVVTGDGRGRLVELSELLPLPIPADAPIRGSLYTAPELTTYNSQADARANLYSFGAVLYSLHVGRELTEMDFSRPGDPKAFVPRFPDIHPAFGRLMMKTFVRQPEARFPSDEAVKEDASGFTELIRNLDACGRMLDNVRLDVSAWTTTGMVRTGNEDAFALLHACESRQEDFADSALILLCDGMGGYDAGEVAAAVTIQQLRKLILAHKTFAALAGATSFAGDLPRAEGNPLAPFDVEEAKKLIRTALKDANRFIYNEARSGRLGKRGMGCTAEAVYVNGRHLIVGHVGDSRTYHLQEGRLIQVTRDQTLVNRLVELGQLTEEEAEDHPRKNELQQAIGGQPDVEPGIYHAVLKPGDWIIVCSDGMSNHVKNADLAQMLQNEALFAEMAARRLVNLVNIEGATDNATVVAVRAM